MGMITSWIFSHGHRNKDLFILIVCKNILCIFKPSSISYHIIYLVNTWIHSPKHENGIWTSTPLQFVRKLHIELRTFKNDVVVANRCNFVVQMRLSHSELLNMSQDFGFKSADYYASCEFWIEWILMWMSVMLRLLSEKWRSMSSSERCSVSGSV